jgi:hypothetical protein
MAALQRNAIIAILDGNFFRNLELAQTRVSVRIAMGDERSVNS